MGKPLGANSAPDRVRRSRKSTGIPMGLHAGLTHGPSEYLLSILTAEELVHANPVSGIERPKVPRRRWRILEPREVPRVAKAFSDDRARRVFLTLTLTGLRRSELLGLCWRHVNLVEGTLRVVESKSEEGEEVDRTLSDARGRTGQALRRVVLSLRR